MFREDKFENKVDIFCLLKLVRKMISSSFWVNSFSFVIKGSLIIQDLFSISTFFALMIFLNL